MKLHLGCGSNYILDWVNVDLDSPVADVRADLRYALPFADSTADFIYCEHLIEHLTRTEGLNFLRECRRVLSNHGVLRLSTPDLRWLVAQYLAGNLGEWRDVGWEPESSCRLLNEGMRSWGHYFLYDEDELREALRQSGFSAIVAARHHESEHPLLAGLECRPWHRELIFEAH